MYKVEHLSHWENLFIVTYFAENNNQISLKLFKYSFSFKGTMWLFHYIVEQQAMNKEFFETVYALETHTKNIMVDILYDDPDQINNEKL